jgi:hypothetical protein
LSKNFCFLRRGWYSIDRYYHYWQDIPPIHYQFKYIK